MSPSATIFIVEDEALIAMDLRCRLERRGYTVVGTAARGEKALELLRTIHADLVLMDINLAGEIDGIETARRLRESADTPVIFVTAYSDNALIERAGHVDPFGYLIKPFEERELHANIQMALYKHRMERALHEANTGLEAAVRARTSELQQSEARLEHLLTAAPVTIHSSLGRPPYAAYFISANIVDLLGYPAEDFLRQPGFWASQLHPDDLARIEAGLASLRPGGTLVQEYRFRHRDGTWRWLQDTLRVADTPAGHAPEFIGHCIDITQRKLAEQRAERQQAMLADVRLVQQQFIAGADRSQAFDQLLAALLRHTGSAFGFIGEVLHHADGSPYLQTHAISDVAWNDATRAQLATHRETGLRFENLHTLFGQVMVTRAPVISDNPADDPRRGGHLPAGHPPLQSFAGLPILVGSELVGMVGLANRPGGYQLAELSAIDPLLATYGSLILAWRQRRMRQEAEESRRESESRLHDLIENTNDLIQSTAPDGTLLFVNRAWCETLGYTKDEALSLNIFTLIHPDSLDHCTATLGRLMQGESVGLVDVVFRARDGRRIDLEGNISIRHENGRPVSTRGIFRDVTARKQAEAALRDVNANLERLVEERTTALRVSEERFRLVHQAVFNVIWDQDLESETIWWSERFQAIFGHDRTIAARNGDFWREHLHPDDRTRATASVAAALEGTGDIWHADYRFRRADGTYAYVEDRAHIVRDAAGRAIRLLGAMQDVTDRKMAEFELQEAERRHRTLLGNLRGMAYRRLPGHGYTLSYASEGAGELLGYPPAQLIATDSGYSSLIHPDDLPRILDITETILATREHYQIEYRVRRADGTERWVWDQGCGVFDGDRLVSIEGFITDITEGKEAKQRLAASEDNLRHLANASPAGIFATDAQGQRRFVSARWSQITGLDMEQSLHAAWGATLHPDDSPRVHAVWDAAFRNRRPFAHEYRFVNPRSGRVVWVFGQAEPVIHADGEFDGYIGTLTDVTEQKLIELALRTLSTELVQLSGQAYYQAAVRKLATLLESEDAFIGLWNQARPENLHLVAHCHDGRFQPQQDHDLLRSACAEVLQRGQPLIADDISTLFPVGAWVRSATPRGYGAMPIKDSTNRVVGLVGVASNNRWANTGRVETILGLFAVSLGAELESQRSHARFRTLFEFSPDAIVMADRAGVIRHVNQRAAELFGWTREELVGQQVEILIPPSERGGHAGHRARYVAHAQPRRMGDENSHLHARRKDGSVFPADISLSPIETDEGMLVAAAVRDTTKQREAEELRRRAELEIRQAQKMESLGTLAGGIAHDFNNILTGMLGFVELARLDLPGNHPARPWIEQIGASGQRAKGLVRQILTFSRKDMQKEHVPTRLQAVVGEAIDLLRSSVPAMVKIERRLAKECPPVMADATQIHQVIMNLGTNAWRALPAAGGLISVELDTCTITPEEAASLAPLRPGTTLKISVTDTGCGMEPAVLERIFEPFFTTRPVGEGTGLGLSAVHGIVRAHDGAIRVASTPGKGTRFDVFLPAILSEPPQTAPTASYQRGNGERILLVDDDLLGREALQIILNRVGFTVTHFRTPKEALEHFRAAPDKFDLLVTDYAMPGMSGLALLEAVRALRPDLPALLISGNLAQVDLTALASDPRSMALGKPLMLPELTKALHELLARAR